MSLDLFTAPETWIALLTLTVLEVVLGVDNLVFISVMTGRLPVHKRKSARQIGLALACIMRLLLLGTVTWMTKLTAPIFSLLNNDFSWRDLVLIGGGLFLLAKGTSEIHLGVAEKDEKKIAPLSASFSWVIMQIVLLDIIFSLDSVMTAVGMVQEFTLMAIAIIIAVLLMMWASGPLSALIHKNPSLKMLALSFLLLVGVVLIADGFSFHIPRGYLYFAITFSLFVEALNILAGKRKRSYTSRH